MTSSQFIVALLLLALSVLEVAASYHVLRDTLAAETLTVSLSELVSGSDNASTFIIGPNVQFAPGANLEVDSTALPYGMSRPTLRIEDCQFSPSSGGVIFTSGVANWNALVIQRITASFVMFTNSVENVTSVAVTDSNFSAIGNGDHQAVSFRGGAVSRVGSINVENNTFTANKGIDNYHSNIGVLVLYGQPTRGLQSIAHVGSLYVRHNTLRAVVRARPGFYGHVNVALRVRVAALIVDSPGSHVGIVNVSGNFIIPDVYVLTNALKQKSNGNKAGNALTHCSTAAVNFFSYAWANLRRIIVSGNSIVDGQQIPATFAAQGGTVFGLLLGNSHTVGYLTVVTFQPYGNLNMSEFRVMGNTIRNVTIRHQPGGHKGRFSARFSAHYFVTHIGSDRLDTTSGLGRLVIENNTLESHSSPSDYFSHGASGLLSVGSSVEASETHFVVAGNSLNATGTIVRVVDWQAKQGSVSNLGDEALLGQRPLLAIANNRVRSAVVDTSVSLFALVSAPTVRDLWGVAMVGNVVRATVPAFNAYTSRVLPASILSVSEPLVPLPERCDLQLRHVDVFHNAFDLETRKGVGIYYPSFVTFDTSATGTVPIPRTSVPCNYTHTAVRIVANTFRHFSDVQRHLPALPAPMPTRGSAISLPLRAPHSHLFFLSLNQFIGWNASGAPVVTNDVRNHSFGLAAKFYWESNGPVGPVMRNESFISDPGVRASLSTDVTRRSMEFPAAAHVFVAPSALRRCSFDTQCSRQDSDADIGATRDGDHCWCVCRETRWMRDAWRVPPSLQCTLTESLASLPDGNTSQADWSVPRIFGTTTQSATVSRSVSLPPTATPGYESVSSTLGVSMTARPRRETSSTPSVETEAPLPPLASSGSTTAIASPLSRSSSLSTESHNNSLASSAVVKQDQIPPAVTTAVMSTARVVTGFGATLVGPSSVARAGRLGSSRRALLCVFDPEDVAPPFAEQPVQFPLGFGSASEGFQRLAGASACSGVLVLAASSLRLWMFRLAGPGCSSFVTSLSGVAAAVLDGFFVPALLGNAVFAAVHSQADVPIVAVCVVAATVALVTFVLDTWSVVRGTRFWRAEHVQGVYTLHDMKLVTSSGSPSPSIESTQHYVPFVATFGLLFDGCRNPLQLVSRVVFVEEVASSMAVTMATNIRPTSADACPRVALCVLVVCALHLGYIMIVRPYAARIENAFSGVFALLQLASAGVAASTIPIDDAIAAVDLLTLCQSALLIIQPIAIICHSHCVVKSSSVTKTEGASPLLEAPTPAVETGMKSSVPTTREEVCENPLAYHPPLLSKR